MLTSRPIIVLDSGLGGLTVAREIRRRLPAESLIYFGDTARLPYGSKSAEAVTGFVRQIVGYLQQYDPKHVVVACNTATALSLPALIEAFPHLAISGVIEPGATAALRAVGDRMSARIGLIATEATVRARAYERAILFRRTDVRLLARATPLLVPIIEEGRGTDDPVVRLALRQYLEPMLATGIDALVLGCTHYPILKNLIAEIAGPSVRVIDSAEQCAEDVAQRLRASGQLRRGDDVVGEFRSLVTDDVDRFALLATRFLGLAIDSPARITLEELAAGDDERQRGRFRVAV